MDYYLPLTNEQYDIFKTSKYIRTLYENKCSVTVASNSDKGVVLLLDEGIDIDVYRDVYFPFIEEYNLDSLTKKEFNILQTYIRDTLRVLITEARLGRLTDNNMEYYRSYFTRMELNLDNKLFRDYIEKYWLNRIANQRNRDEYSSFMNVVKESWEEATGRKFELKK